MELKVLSRVCDQILGQDVLHELERFVEEKLLLDAGVF